MRKLMLSITAAALAGLVGVALAASGHVAKAEFNPLTVQGVRGKVDLVDSAVEGINVKVQARNLQPQQDYIVIWYSNANCTPEATENVVGRFRSNPAGIGLLQTKLDKQMPDIGSISVRLATDPTILACASFE